MFEAALLESAHRTSPQSRWPALASLGIQVAIAAVLLAIPIVHPEALPLHLSKLEFTPPPPPEVKPPPIERVHVEASTSIAPAVPVTEVMTTGARRTPTPIDPTNFSDLPPSNNASMIGGNTPNGASLLGPAGNSTSPTVVVAAIAKPSRISVSTGVYAGSLLRPIQPIYPPIAKAARQEGTVIIHAIISKDGHIVSANAVSGPPMLQGAALDAVRSARYRPYLLNGLPTEVDTTFQINFRLSGS